MAAMGICLGVRPLSAADEVAGQAVAQVAPTPTDGILASMSLAPVVANVTSLPDTHSATPTQSELLYSAPPAVVTTPTVTHKIVRQIWMDVTAYCACTKCCGPNAQGVTASGHRVTFNNGRFVAADTDVLPFGTLLEIPGYHSTSPVQVIDRGSAIKGNRLDVYFSSHEQAMRWGHRWLLVSVVE